MNYDESLAYIESLAPTILNPDLTRLARFMEVNGSPQNSFRTLHVAGTNGKGSTVAVIDSILRAAGFKVGRFTGPHLLRWNERFHLNGSPISDETLARLVTMVRERSEQFGREYPQHGSLTWFELLTAVAFFYFAENQIDFGVFEVGLGGRWDATNVIERPLVSGITTIGLDHTHILGSTISKIAREKAGIIKQNVPIVTGTAGDALDTISDRAAELDAPLFVCRAPHKVNGPQLVDTEPFAKEVAKLALLGSYQRLNALIAYTMISVAQQTAGLSLLSHLSDGLSSVYWPGRFQWLEGLNLLLDGAHNAAGAKALRSALDEHFPGMPITFVLCFFQNKDVPGALQHLLRPGDRVIASQAKTSRAVCDPELIVEHALAARMKAETAPSVENALQLALATTGSKGVVVATGSLATVKESMLSLGWRSVEDGIKSTWGFSPEGCKIHT